MEILNKRSLLILIACILSGLLMSAQVETVSLPSSLPPPPFLAMGCNSKEVFINKPIVGSESIRYGNKELRIRDNGMLSILISGKELCQWDVSLNTEFENWMSFESLLRRDTAFKRRFVADTNRGIFEYFVDVPLEKNSLATGKLIQRISLQEDGRLEISARLEIPEDKIKTLDMARAFYVLRIPGPDSFGEKVILDGKDIILPNVRKFGDECFLLNKPTNGSALFFSDHTDKAFGLVGISSDRFLGGTFPQANHTQVRFYPSKDTRVIRFILDLRRGVESAASDRRAGIDFAAIEALELPDIHSCRNLLRNPSFEQGFMHLESRFSYNGRGYYEKFFPQAFHIDGTTAKHGRQSLRIDTWQKTCIGDYRGLLLPGNLTTSPVPLNPGKYTLSMWAKGDRPGAQELSVWCPNSVWFGNQHLPFKGAQAQFKPGAVWAPYRLSLEVPQGMAFIVNFNATSETGDGHVWVDALQLETGEQTSDFSARPVEGNLLSSDPGNFINSRTAIKAVLNLSTTAAASGQVEVWVKDFFGEVLFNASYPFRADAQGFVALPLPLDGLLPTGIHVVKAVYTLVDGRTSYDFFRLAVMEFLDQPFRLRSLYSINYGDTTAMPFATDTLTRWQHLGVGSKTHAQSWDNLNFDKYESFGVKAWNAYLSWCVTEKNSVSYVIKTSIYGRVTESNTLLRDYHQENTNGVLTEEYLGRFKQVVQQLVRSHPAVRLWSFGCEDDAKYPDWAGPNASESAMLDYGRILISFQKAVKSVDPSLQVFQGAPCNMAPESGIRQIERSIAAVKKQVKFDVIGAHIYRAKPENPDLDADTSLLLKVLEKQGYGQTPIFWPEGMHWGPYVIPQWGVQSASWGPPTAWYHGALSYDMGWTEKISAAWYARAYLVALKYQDRLLVATSGADVNNFALDCQLTPFAFQKIPNTLGGLLGDAAFRQDIRFMPYSRCYVFEDRKTRPIAVVWNYHPEIDAGRKNYPVVEVRFEGQIPEVFDLMQARRNAAPEAGGGLRFPVSPFPLFFRGEVGSLAAMTRAFNRVSMISGEGFSPLVLGAKPSSTQGLSVQVKNLLSQDYTGSLRLAGENRAIIIPAGSGQTLGFILPVSLVTDRMSRVDLPAALVASIGGAGFNFDLSFEGFIARKNPGVLSLVGRSETWAGIPAIPFRNRWLSKGVTAITDRDYSGAYRVAWDAERLYLRVEITDDQFVHEEYSDPRNRWENDSLQVYFDTLADARMRETRGYDENDYEYGVWPTADGKRSVVFRSRLVEAQLGLATQAPKEGTVADDIPSTFTRTKDGYVYEVAFPAKYLLPIELKAGAAFGFALFVNDRDDGKSVKSALTLSPTGTSCYNSPHLWPLLLLVP